MLQRCKPFRNIWICYLHRYNKIFLTFHRLCDCVGGFSRYKKTRTGLQNFIYNTHSLRHVIRHTHITHTYIYSKWLYIQIDPWSICSINWFSISYAQRTEIIFYRCATNKSSLPTFWLLDGRTCKKKTKR